MKIAVCMKYVPIIARIQFDYAARTIVREGVPSEVNPFDLLGVIKAAQLKAAPGDEVVVLTMGPPAAAEGLTQCLALGADRAVLLSDRALAGSDTLATARALALALAREQPDLIICGRNSTDGETGQVGPEVAELLGLPHISAVRRLDLLAGRQSIEAERITDEGFQTLQCDLPALVCVTEGIAPELYPNRAQMEEAAAKPTEQISCADLRAGPTPDSPDSDDDAAAAPQFGADGSPTRVSEIRLVEPNRLGVTLQDATPAEAARQVAEAVRERLRELAAVQSSGGAESGGAAVQPRYPGRRERSIWVVAESTRSGLAQVTYEMLGKARELTAVTQSEVTAVAVNPHAADYAAALTEGGADRVLALDDAALGPPCSRAAALALAAAVERERPYAVLFAATADGRDLAARLAARMQLGLTGDAIDLEIDAEGRLVQLKPALGGNVVAPILSKTLPNLVTLRPGLLSPAPPEAAAPVVLERPAYAPFRGADVRLVRQEFQDDDEGLELARARIVLGLGMGAGADNVPALRELARSLNASVATTRDVVHAGWLPQQLQVGISGRTIAPAVYLAIGIRGAFNHTVGLQRAGVIIAVNRNRRATIFRSADFGIIGDWEEFLPPLIEELRPVLAELE